MPAPDYLLPLLTALGDGATVGLAERVHQMLADATAGATPAAKPGPEVNDRPMTVTLQADDVEGLLYQIVGCCSSTRFWDEMPANYPYGAGTFREGAARTLAAAAMDEYRRLTAPTDIHTLIDDSSLGEPDAAAARARVSDEDAAACVARAVGLADEPDDGIDWGDDETDAQLAAAIDGAKTMEGHREPTNAEVRAWCIEQGVPVNAKGAVRAKARAAYDAAHQEA
jgi:hypothetical protein